MPGRPLPDRATAALQTGTAGERLSTVHDVGLLDLDGVVYVGPEPVPGAADAIRSARADGMRVAYVTNNASRTPQRVAEHLTGLGVDATPADVVTSAQAAARLLREHVPPGASVLVVGADGLTTTVHEAGYTVVGSADDRPAAVVQGHSPQTSYADLAEAALAIRAGALWVAGNTDSTLPSPRGLLPGNGALVAALVTATGREPLVAGKPAPALHLESVERTGARHPLVVGDRLDTDVEGAVNAGCASLLVLTGVTTAADLMGAPPHHRPTYLARDLSGLTRPHAELSLVDGDVTCAGWRASTVDGASVLSGDGAEPADALRVLCVGAWESGRGDHTRIRAQGPAATRALGVLGLGPEDG